jgi:hypothetical protein
LWCRDAVAGAIELPEIGCGAALWSANRPREDALRTAVGHCAGDDARRICESVCADSRDSHAREQRKKASQRDLRKFFFMP